MTPEQLVARKKKLASAARALITGELGLVRASNHIRRALESLGSEKPDSFVVFDQFYKAIPLDIPLGVARLQWPIDLLLKHDSRLEKIEAEYKPALLRAAAELVKRYG